ncbi:MAG: four helix bundle protein [Bacteroidota bacterium]|nr:four helix bundle protein [Bacteroidota bacterium]
MRNFRELEVWKMAVDFVTEVYSITKELPENEKYGLISQINRSVISIPANIAEGSSRKTSADFARFLEIALGSSFELETYFEIMNNLGLLAKVNYQKLIEELNLLQKKINALRKSILNNN